MRSQLLDLEYEFDMIDVQVYTYSAAAIFLFIFWAVYMTTGIFSYSFGIPFILLLVFYVVLDEHNDQIKTINDLRIQKVLEYNTYNQLTHIHAINYLQGGYKK